MQAALPALKGHTIGFAEAAEAGTIARLKGIRTTHFDLSIAKYHGCFVELIVIAPNSTMVCKGRPIDVREVGRQLNVGFVSHQTGSRDNQP